MDHPASDEAPLPTPGTRLRLAREAAGLSRQQVALGFHFMPDYMKLIGRAEWLGMLEHDGVALSEADLALFEHYIAQLATILPAKPAPGRAAA